MLEPMTDLTTKCFRNKPWFRNDASFKWGQKSTERTIKRLSNKNIIENLIRTISATECKVVFLQNSYSFIAFNFCHLCVLWNVVLIKFISNMQTHLCGWNIIRSWKHEGRGIWHLHCTGDSPYLRGSLWSSSEEEPVDKKPRDEWEDEDVQRAQEGFWIRLLIGPQVGLCVIHIYGLWQNQKCLQNRSFQSLCFSPFFSLINFIKTNSGHIS